MIHNEFEGPATWTTDPSYQKVDSGKCKGGRPRNKSIQKNDLQKGASRKKILSESRNDNKDVHEWGRASTHDYEAGHYLWERKATGKNGERVKASLNSQEKGTPGGGRKRRGKVALHREKKYGPTATRTPLKRGIGFKKEQRVGVWGRGKKEGNPANS